MKTIILVPRIAMLLKAMEFYGLNEIPGEKNNPQIIQFFKDIGYEWVQTDETAWCGAFINWIAKQCDCQKSGRLDARSWLNIGSKTEKPQLGNIVVFWRESLRSWKGHVGIYVNQDEKNIYCLGGNQSNQVNIKPYPKNQLLGFRTLDYI
jgi:uncharacterized protein (TIGR02594 family)